MRIGVNCFLLQANIGGLKQYFVNLFDWLLENDLANEYIFFYFEHNLEELGKLRSNRWRHQAKLLPGQEAIECHLKNLDVYFCPFNALWPRPANLPTVVTLVDIQEMYHPDFFSPIDLYNRAWHYPASTRAADRVVTISAFSKESIAKYHGLSRSKIIVAHLCADRSYFNASAMAAPVDQPLPFERFVFFPANRWAHKNHDGLLRAVKLLQDRQEDVNVVFTGYDVSGGYPVREKAREYGVSDRVHTAGYVTVPQMAYLYRWAEMLVFPSLFEGFGMPPVEAMAAGCPVAASISTCLPEICGDAAEYFDPADPVQIAEAILRIRKNPKLRAALIDRGSQRAIHFSAEALGRAHIRAFEEAIGSYSNLRYKWHKKIYQPFHKWRVDKIQALEMPQSGGLFLPWMKKVVTKSLKVATDLSQAPGQRASLIGRGRQLRLIRDSKLFHEEFYRSQVGVAVGSSGPGHYLLKGAKANLKPNPLFDGAWYWLKNPDVLAAGWNPLVHFIKAGVIENRDPHPLFDVSWYKAQYADVAEFGLNPLGHYLQTGAKEGRNPHPLFLASHYLSVVQDYDLACPNPLIHYLAQSPEIAQDPHPLFDGKWYLEDNPDVRAAGVNPLVHYLSVGAAEGRNPNPSFDTAAYLTQHPDVKECGINPLLHSIGIKPSRYKEIELIETSGLFDIAFYRSQTTLAEGASPVLHYIYTGVKLGLNPHPFFDAEWYLQRNPDVAAFGVNPFLHFITRGRIDDRDPHPLFDLSWYIDQHRRELQDAQIHPMQHAWERYGFLGPDTHSLLHHLQKYLSGTSSSHLFDGPWYLAKNPDVAGAGLDPLLHYLKDGRFEGRDPSPSFDTQEYLRRHPEVKLNKINPMLHYLKIK